MDIWVSMDLMFDALRLGALATGLPGDRPLRAAEEARRHRGTRGRRRIREKYTEENP